MGRQPITRSGPGQRTGRPPGSRAAKTRDRLLAVILEEHRRTSLWPGRHWLAESLSVSPRLVTRYRQDLIKEGRLPQEAAAEAGLRARWLQPTIPLLGVTAGGPPALVAAEGDPLDLVELLTAGRPGCFGLVVTGTSMAGPPHFITPGAIAVIHRQPTADEGAICLVQINDPQTGEPRTTIKRISHDGEGRLVLRCSDGTPLELDSSEVEVIGEVLSVVHRIR
jgi:SOS-response transcriptional repressor LexA